ncbi:MAG: oligosaccharide flippase family protein, partial [Planctomycetes bacterium]|nr:oligosaccharide flippase family protein [Planctomycetota bacterium]
MTSTHNNNPTLEGGEPSHDVSGREPMARNVIAGWLAQFFFIAGGFVLPRLVNDRLSQDALGVWDFAWSLTGLFGILQGGIVSSVNRFVAKFRARNDVEGISCAVSSVSFVLGLIALLVFTLAISIAFFAPVYLKSQLGDHAEDAKWVIFLLGTSFAVQVATSAFGGVITGHHRWDIQYGIHAVVYIVQFLGMIAAVLLGGGLVAMAITVLVCETAGRVVRAIYAYRLCPGLRVRPCCIRRDMMARMVSFGGKSLMPDAGGLLEYQVVTILITYCLGLPMVAVYSRPQGLIRHALTLVERFASVLTPTVSSLKATKSNSALRDLLTKATRVGIYLALPMVLGLVLMGDKLLLVWMGKQYSTARIWLLLVVLAIGHLATMVQLPIRNILMGLNAHGRTGFANFCSAIVSAIAAAITLLYYKQGLVGVALAVTIPMTLVNGLYVPWYACRLMKMNVASYAYACLRGPVLCAIPFSACLIAARIWLEPYPLIALLSGSA